jgi:hypothetical protein
MQLFNKSIFLLLVVIMFASCNGTDNATGENGQSLAPTIEEWSLWLCNVDGSDCAKQYYVEFTLYEQNGGGGDVGYGISRLTPIIQTSGQIALGDAFWTNGQVASPPDVTIWWQESIVGSTNTDTIECSGKASRDEMSGECTQGWQGAWKAQRGLVDLENGSFEKDIASGKTRLYFRAWTENASSVYIAATFIDGQIELVKCDEIKYYSSKQEEHTLDIWKISSSPTCSSEGYYEFPSTSTPLVVQTHIVTDNGEIIREKTITEGVELNTGTTGTN